MNDTVEKIVFLLVMVMGAMTLGLITVIALKLGTPDFRRIFALAWQVSILSPLFVGFGSDMFTKK
jgi:hypothetical protein